MTLVGFQCQPTCLVHDVEELCVFADCFDFVNHCADVVDASTRARQPLVVDLRFGCVQHWSQYPSENQPAAWTYLPHP